ncbi:neurogenic locus notch homolog protein 2-like isoform X2 [Xenia sp. Carnegie-2017]|uniref:neurogenic locus notch homolog protein 2-like isoform X2 n=1 Tax=Xenia sp. Carnegie-2017 TaxID=2897299 RepID=UPI001F03C7E9|nr:neurogenic locus notch homolog protein 2-like isoform X2 [Xenia sp. Carnegie-2017]
MRLFMLFVVVVIVHDASCWWFWRRRRRRPRRRYCRTPGSWSSWSSCNHHCGNAGVQIRTRKLTSSKWIYGSCPRYNLRQTRPCNRNNCRNGGRQTYGRCICSSCYTGTCCEKPRRRNCLVSPWSPWSSCNHRCGNAGVQTRTRRKIRPESCGGHCYVLLQTRACNRNKCRNGGKPTHGRCICLRCSSGTCCNIKAPPRKCVVSRWSTWSSCNHRCGNAGVQKRTRYKIRPESCGGSCPYKLKDKRACNRYKCRNGGRPTYGRCICSSCYTGTCCEKPRQRNCVVSSWSSWSSCNHKCGNAGVQTRARRKIVKEICGGRCPYRLRQRRSCNRNKCLSRGWSSYGRCICYSCWRGKCCNIKARRRNCLVSSWTSWSSCNHQCGSAGVQTRTRYKTRKESCGGRCPYSLRRTRACNRNKCRNGGRPTYGRCICRSGWKGKCCNIRIGVCNRSLCKNGGSCLVDGRSYKCICLPDFIGVHCEKEVANPCKPNPCKNGGQCNVLGNIYTCKCKPKFGGYNCEHSQTTCYASGDPHYTSFDGKRFDFMGDCEYEFAKDCEKNKLFTVLTKNERCGRRVTCTAAVKIIIAGYFIQLTRQRGTANINGVRLSKFPIVRRGFKITYPGRSWLIFTADIGMSASWDFRRELKVTVSGKYKGMICNTSLCGNNNGRKGDDHHYSRKCAPPPTPCIPDFKKKAVIDKCHLMADRSSPFHGACNRYFDPAALISNCKYDACRCTDPMKCVCNAFAAYSKLCVEYGGLIDWRFKGTYLYPKLKECEQTCSNKGEIFTECGSACAKTCRDISRGLNCSETCIPGCHCPKGSYLDDKNHCVPMKNCTCFFEGKYYKAGENVKVGRCKTCTCNMGAMACVEDRNCSSKGPCESFPCKNDGVCIEKGNNFTCNCTKEYQGKTCEELKPTPCDSGPCKNNGTCTNKGDNFTCECADGFEGKTCKVMNACAKEPCKNDGVCASNGSPYQCECKFGFIGKNCQYMDVCAKETCQNNGTCTSVGSSYKCNCTSGFNGTNCEDSKVLLKMFQMEEIDCLSTQTFIFTFYINSFRLTTPKPANQILFVYSAIDVSNNWESLN